MSPGRLELEALIGAPGLALGRARLIFPIHFEVDSAPIAAHAVDAEIAHLNAAFEAARAELGTLGRRLRRERKPELAELVEAHALMLGDRQFADAIVERIRRERLSAIAALVAQRNELGAAFEAIEDPYLRSRREDIDHVAARVAAALRRGEQTGGRRRAVDGGEILICESLAPTDLDHWHQQGVLGIVQSAGSAFAHVAILARNMGVPVLCGVAGALEKIRDGDLLLVDAESGRAIVRPDAVDLARLHQHRRELTRRARARRHLRRAPTQTADGAAVSLFVNAEQGADIAVARRLDVAGVGLYRSEFLFLRGHEAPSEDEQFRAYRDAVLAMAGRPVTLRTLDLGADKMPGGMDLSAEANPALGLRGIRLSLARPALALTQLRAMLRASAYGPIRILLPMVTSAEQVRATRHLLDSARKQLGGNALAPGASVELGAMIEVPAAALAAASIAREASFLAIGSNDLVQYTLAADRNNAALGSAYDPFHPAVLKLIAQTVEAARHARRPLVFCGELASDPQYLPLLIALGVEALSVRTSAVLEVRETVLALSRKQLRARSRELLAAEDREGIDRVMAAATPE